MNLKPSPAGQTASIPGVRRLLAVGLLDEAEARGMEEELRAGLPWRLWLDRGMLSLAAALILAGIVCFFAHNWNRMGDVLKLGLTAGGVLAAFAGSLWVGKDRFGGKLLLLAASALVGVFLAVFGQIYQTGADSYEMFALWAVLILPWVVLGRFAPLWACWVTLVNVTVYCYWQSVIGPRFQPELETLNEACLSLVMVNSVALLAREIAGWRAPAWLDRGWFPLLLVTAIVALFTWKVALDIFDQPFSGKQEWSLGFAVFYPVWIAVLGGYYGFVRYSLPALALTMLSVCLVLTFLMIRVLFDQTSDPIGGMFIAGVAVLGMFGGSVWLLLAIRRAHLQV